MLTFEAYADAVADAATALRANAARAGLDGDVPTCPGWSVHRLVAHQGMVHRWAAAAVRGERVDPAPFEQAGLASPDVLDWLADGAEELLRTLDHAPEDLDAWFFLADAPPAKLAWTRRQCHETTIHAVDAMSAVFGSPPPASALWFRPSIAADGVDELLTGFLPRPTSRLRPEHPMRIVVTATDTGDAWTLDTGPDGTATRRGDQPDATTRLAAPAVDLYLGLWNRGSAITETGEPFLDRWRSEMTVTWG